MQVWIAAVCSQFQWQCHSWMAASLDTFLHLPALKLLCPVFRNSPCALREWICCPPAKGGEVYAATDSP